MGAEESAPGGLVVARKPRGIKPLAGAVFVPLTGAEKLGPHAAGGRVQVTLVVRHQSSTADFHEDERWSALPHERELDLRPEDHHAHEGDLDAVRRFAEGNGLEVVSVSAQKRTLVLSGTAEAVGSAFHIDFVRYRHGRGEHRGYEGQVHVPEDLDGVVTAVLGLHDRPIARPNLAPGAGGSTLSATDLSRLYAFPEATTGAKQTIGIIELGGGYRDSDLTTFFGSLELEPPKVTWKGVDGAKNSPEDVEQVRATMEWLSAAVADPANATAPPGEGSATVETTMDIEIAGALAPGADIVVYFAQPTELSLYNAIHAALEPGGPTLISFSWSWNEHLSDGEQAQIGDLLERCARNKVTFCVGSGDRGSMGSPANGTEDLNPQFPATSPWALGCGGTRLKIEGDEIREETVWNTVDFGESSGGGVSRVGGLPGWQPKDKVPVNGDDGRGRGVPDVAAVADPETHCRIFVGGAWGPAAGTSASAPLWAALVARLNESLGLNLGYLNPLLYRLAREKPDLFRQVLDGNNGAYEAGSGWNACTGLGGPRGDRLLAALRGE